MSNAGFFYAAGERNEIPSAADRVGSPFWSWMSPALGIETHRPGRFSTNANFQRAFFTSVVADSGDGSNEAIRKIRRYEARRQPRPVGIVGAVAEAIGDAVDEVKAVVKNLGRASTGLARGEAPTGPC